MELHRTATDLERQQVTADRFEGSAAGGCVQMRQRFSVLPGKRARQVGHLKVFVALRLVFAGFEIDEAEGDLASEPEARKHGRRYVFIDHQRSQTGKRRLPVSRPSEIRQVSGCSVSAPSRDPTDQ